MPSESRIRQILSEFIPRLAPASVGVVSNSAVGRVFYVTNAASNESDTPGGGTSWANPLATIDYAIGQCVAARGDVIMVGPGHVETVTAAAGIALDVAGVSIVGVGNRRNRPRINFTTSVDASMTISGANCRVENLWFTCSIDDQTVMLDVSGAASTIKGCEFTMGDATYDAENGVSLSSAADNATIEGNTFSSTSGTDIPNALSVNAADNTIIRGNIFYGYFGTGGAIANGAAAVGLQIIDNYIVNRTADGNNKAIVLHSSTNGIIANNRMAIIDSTSPAPVTAAAGYVSGNYFTGAVGVSASTLQ